MSFPAPFGARRALNTAANPRLSAIVGLSQDPWAPFQLCPGASEADKAAYASLRAAITAEDALPSVKTLADQKWSFQQSALTYDADRNTRLLSLLRDSLPYHKKTQDAAAINTHIDRLLRPLTVMPDGTGKTNRPRLTPEENAKREALLRIKADHTLVTPKMLEEAYAANRAHEAAEAQKKKERNEKLLREQMEREAASAAALSAIRTSGWA
jgi:hypothetical protein